MLNRVLVKPRSPWGIHLLVGGCAILAMATQSHAEQLFYDPFTVGDGPGKYTLGPLPGQPDDPIWSGPFFEFSWMSPLLPEENSWYVQSSSLQPGEGGSVRAVYDGITNNGRIGRYLRTEWGNNTDATYYLSCLVNFGTTEGGDGGIGFRAIEMWPADGTIGDDTGRSYFGYSQWTGPFPREPDSARMALVTPWGYSVPEDGPPSYDEDGHTHMVVFKFELSSAAGSDTVSVFLDPLDDAGIDAGFLPLFPVEEPAVPSAVISGVDFTLGAIGFSQFGGGTVDTMMFDEIRVGTTFSDVIPPGVPPVSWEDLFDIVASHMNLGVSGGWMDGDIGLADGTPGSDGRVTIGDFRVWKDHPYEMGGGSLLTIAAVPEPTGIVLVLAAGVACLGRVRARR